MTAPYLLKPICNKVNVNVSALPRVRKFIPSELMVNIYKAFILPHLEYCAPVLVGLSSGLSNKLELTNQYAIRTLLNMAKSASYSDLITYVGLKTLEHDVDILLISPFFTNAYTIWGRIILRRCSYFIMMNMTSEASASLISPPITVDLCIGHIITSPQDYGTICLTM